MEGSLSVDSFGIKSLLFSISFTMQGALLKGTSTPTKTSLKPQDIVFAITLVLIFVQKSVYSGEKRSLESRIFVFKFPGRRHLE